MEEMNQKETANLIYALRAVGFSDTQITDFQLAVEGGLSLEEWKEKYLAEEKRKAD